MGTSKPGLREAWICIFVDVEVFGLFCFPRAGVGVLWGADERGLDGGSVGVIRGRFLIIMY